MTVAPRVRAERCALRESELNRDPSFGGWPGYEPWFRQIVVGLSIHPNDTMTTPSGNPTHPPLKNVSGRRAVRAMTSCPVFFDCFVDNQ